MDNPSIQLEYRDTPEKYHQVADEVIAFLLENLRMLNAAQEEYTLLNRKVERGIRMKGLPKSSKEVWAQYKMRCSEIVVPFCTEKLLARGFAQSMANEASDGEKVFGDYAYLNYGCKLTITMKSEKCVVVEALYTDEDDLNCWKQFTLNRSNDGWKLADIKYKFQGNDKWKNDTI